MLFTFVLKISTFISTNAMLSYLWQGLNKIMDVGLFRCQNNFAVRHFPTVVAVGDVIGDRNVEESWFLRHQTHPLAETANVQRIYFFVIDFLKGTKI